MYNIAASNRTTKNIKCKINAKSMNNFLLLNYLHKLKIYLHEYFMPTFDQKN